MAVEEYTGGECTSSPKEVKKMAVVGTRRVGNDDFPTNMPKAFIEQRRQANGDRRVVIPALFFQGFCKSRKKRDTFARTLTP